MVQNPILFELWPRRRRVTPVCNHAGVQPTKKGQMRWPSSLT